MGQFKVTYQQNNTFTVPPGVTEIFVECLGGGGAGGKGGTLAAGGGGGGGAYAASTLTVSPGTTHSIVVGQQTAATTAGAGVAGSPSTFGAGPLVRAAAGAGGGAPSGLGGITAGAGGAGGSVANSIGTTRTAGSNGANGGNGGPGAPPLATGGPSFFGNGGNGGAAVSSGNGVGGFQGLVVVTFEYTSDIAPTSDTVNYVVSWKRAFNETATASDAFFKSILKPFNDSVSASDSLIKTVNKTQPESVSVSDNFVKFFRELNSENISATDAINKINRLYRTDAVSASDAITKFVLKKAADDIVVSSDAFTRYISKNLSESVSITDFAFIVLIFIRNLSDTANAIDVISKSMRISKQDAAVAVDLAMKLTKKQFASGVNVTDSAFVQAIYNRAFSSTAATSDLLRKSIGIKFEDNISGSTYIPPVSTGRKKIIVLTD